MAHIGKIARSPIPLYRSQQGSAPLSWLRHSQKRMRVVSVLWVLAFVIVGWLTLYLQAHPTARLAGDVGLIQLIQHIQQPLLVGFINLASALNWPTPAGIIVLAVVLILVICRRWRYAFFTIVAGFLADAVGFWLNGWVHRPRPNDIHIHAVANIGLGSFPSGHVVHVASFYGFLLFLTFEELYRHPQWKRWLRVAQGVCIYFLLVIGVSRLLQGEHWPSDVLAGYLIGGMAVVVMIILYSLVGKLWEEHGDRVSAWASHAARQAADSRGVRIYARAGYVAKGVVYLIVGFMAIATAMRIGGGLIDQAGTTHVIYQQPLGAFFLILAAIGWLGYALWGLINAVLDTDDRGTDLKGSVARLGYGAVGVTYAVLGYVALGLATGKSSGGQSSNKQAQDGTAHLLSAPAGAALVVLIGLVVLGIAGTLFYRAYTAEFRQQLELGQATSQVKMGVILLGRVGNAALGIVFTIIGLFFIFAAIRHDPQQAKGLSGALGALLERPFGNFLLAIVALGLLAYGFFSLAQAKYRRIRPV